MSTNPKETLVTSPFPPRRIRVPVMRHRWESATFLHWPYPVDLIRRHLPAGLEVEPWAGQAWVGLVLFRMHVQAPIGRTWQLVPPFPETNVRTYVVGPGARPGIWFFSLDAGSPSAVVAARALYGLPYYRGTMSLEESEEKIWYQATRRWPGAGAGYEIEVEPGAAMAPERTTGFDHYLTARFTLWNQHARLLQRTDVSHPPWPLHSARLRHLRQELLQSANLPPPEDEPIVHFSPGVEVRIGPPRFHTAP